MEFQRIRLATNEYGDNRQVDQIELWGYDLILRQDIRGERDLMMARNMAEALDIELQDCRREL